MKLMMIKSREVQAVYSQIPYHKLQNYIIIFISKRSESSKKSKPKLVLTFLPSLILGLLLVSTGIVSQKLSRCIKNHWKSIKFLCTGTYTGGFGVWYSYPMKQVRRAEMELRGLVCPCSEFDSIRMICLQTWCVGIMSH